MVTGRLMTRVHSNDEVGSFPRFQKYFTRAGVEAEDEDAEDAEMKNQ
jgi:hypothetical protein